MEMKQTKILKEQIDKIDDLKKESAYGPKFKIWRTTTQNLIEEMFDESYVKF